MKHQGTKTIETPRLILRRFTLEDAPAMYRNWASDPEVTKFLTWPAHSSVEISGRFCLTGQGSMERIPFISGPSFRKIQANQLAPLALFA